MEDKHSILEKDLTGTKAATVAALSMFGTAKCTSQN